MRSSQWCGKGGGEFLAPTSPRCDEAYFSDEGQGLAAVKNLAAKEIAVELLGLHRLQAETLVDNVASQRVLLKNGFVRYGRAADYVKIAGRWHEHLLFQVTFPDADVPG